MRHDLQQFLTRYLNAAGLENSENTTTPLFPTTVRRTKELMTNGMSAGDR